VQKNKRSNPMLQCDKCDTFSIDRRNPNILRPKSVALTLQQECDKVYIS
jgi:hypothetical protein